MTRIKGSISRSWPLLVCTACITLCAACASAPRIDVFILDSQTTQYFVHPIGFEDQALSADVDFTAKVRDGALVAIVCNYSLVGRSRIPDPPTEIGFSVQGDDRVYAIQAVKLLYADVEKRTVRYTSELSPSDFYAIFCGKGPILRVSIGDRAFVLKPTKQGTKQVDATIEQFSYGR
jgi:hypothetical protein